MPASALCHQLTNLHFDNLLPLPARHSLGVGITAAVTAVTVVAIPVAHCLASLRCSLCRALILVCSCLCSHLLLWLLLLLRASAWLLLDALCLLFLAFISLHSFSFSFGILWQGNHVVAVAVAVACLPFLR